MSGNRNALTPPGVFEPDPTNPLAGSYTAADAADWHSQNVRDAWAAAKDPQTWQDAADQYAQGMLMGSVAPEMKAGQWFHGTSGKFDAFNTPEVYLTDHAGQALKYAENAHRPFTGNAGTPRVLSVTPKPGTVYNIDDHIASGMDDGLDLNDVIADWAANGRARGDVRYLEYTHPNAGDQGDHTVRVSLYPQEDLAIGGQPATPGNPLATNAAPEMKGLGLDAAGMKVLRDMTPGAKAAVMDNPAFAKWFGKSKAVDEAGNPATYYHGTNSDFDTFQRIDGGNQYGEGHYFTKNPRDASGYATGDVNRITPEGNAGPNVMPVKLAFDKPYDRRGILSPADIQSLERAANAIDPGRWKRGELARMFDKPYPPNGDNVAYELGSNANEIIRKAGFDAFVDPHMTVVFKPTQIKSAIGNSGKFDPKDPRITAGLAGLMAGGGAAAGVNAGNSE